MTIDKAKLKALAEAATQGEWSHERFGVIQAGPVIQFANGSGRQQIAMATGADWMVQGEQIANAEFMAAANPSVVLALLAEIEQLRNSNEQVCANYNRVSFASEERGKQIDQLKAENEALRRDAKRYRFLRNQHWPVAELAVVCNPKVSVKLGHDCPSGDRLDQQVDGAMIRGASHD